MDELRKQAIALAGKYRCEDDKEATVSENHDDYLDESYGS
jgi:hypothetical protein